jgi:hypothetical protein
MPSVAGNSQASALILTTSGAGFDYGDELRDVPTDRDTRPSQMVGPVYSASTVYFQPVDFS